MNPCSFLSAGCGTEFTTCIGIRFIPYSYPRAPTPPLRGEDPTLYDSVAYIQFSLLSCSGYRLHEERSQWL